MSLPTNSSGLRDKRTKFLAYQAVIATACTQLEWLLRQLNEKP
jgi:hypothetical protein